MIVEELCCTKLSWSELACAAFLATLSTTWYRAVGDDQVLDVLRYGWKCIGLYYHCGGILKELHLRRHSRIIFSDCFMASLPLRVSIDLTAKTCEAL